MHAGGGSFKAQMKKADRSAARYALIIGDDEVAASEVTLKPMLVAGEQARLSLDKAIEELTK
jgi:histidyl-tRNA synthetase